MVERDPIDRLAELADQPLQPDDGFAEQLLAELLNDLDDSIIGSDPAVTVLELRKEDGMSSDKRKWLWLAATAAGLVVVLGAVVLLVGSGDDGKTVTDQPSTSTIPDPENNNDQVGLETTSTTQPASTVEEATEGPSDSELESVGEEFLDAFYSGESSALVEISADDALLEQMLYYQGWAQGAGYEEVQRSCIRTSPGGVTCTSRYDDDLTTVFFGYQAADTYRLKIVDGKIDHVTFTSDDPRVWDHFIGWLALERPEIWAGPCEGHLASGQTPFDCAVAMIAAAPDFMESDAYQGP